MHVLYLVFLINNQKLAFGSCRYLAPEYAEDGIVSVQTDVYAFGIVLLQPISGRKVIDANAEEQQQSLRQWVCCSSCSNLFKNRNRIINE